MRYYIIAGEASGDLHGSNLIKGIIKSDPEAEFRFWGGDLMRDAAEGRGSLAKHYKQASFMGFLEVLRNLRTILGQISECKSDMLNYKPDCVILIDYPGFNFRMAKFAHNAGIKTFYYISPKVWAWKKSRIKLIKKYVDQLFVIFPFEIEFFRQHGVDVIYEGNPIMDSIVQRAALLPDREEFISKNGLDNRPIIALLCGSRKTEIRYNLPIMVELSRHFTDYQFVVAGVPWLDKSVYDNYLEGSDVRFISNQTYELLSFSAAALVTSGTATLETALLGVPEVVFYRSEPISMFIARLVVKIKFISLVNIIMNREVVTELLQSDMSLENGIKELRTILPGGDNHDAMLSDFDTLRKMIGESGASDRFAAQMVKLLKNS